MLVEGTTDMFATMVVAKNIDPLASDYDRVFVLFTNGERQDYETLVASWRVDPVRGRGAAVETWPPSRHTEDVAHA